MSDDLTGSTPPPTPPTPPPAQPPQQASPPRPQPPPPPSGAAGWPWYFGLAALAGGLFATMSISLVVAGIWIAAGGDAEEDAGLIVLSTALQAFIFVGTAILLARSRGRVTMRDFGLVRAPFWPTVGKMFAVMASYFVILVTYNAAVNLSPDDTPDLLGANNGIIGMLLFGILVAVIAPISEELFFRGMVFRSFANRMGIVGAAVASGLLFGSLHIDSFENERLLQVVPLALLGMMFALLYTWSGTLYAPIALHATNNALAVLVFASENDSDFGVVLAIVIWVLMMILCTIGWRFTDNGEPPPPSQAPPSQPPLAAPAPQDGRPVFVQHADVLNPPKSAPQNRPRGPEHPDFPWGTP